MNDDLIKRSDAIEAIEVVDWYHQNRNKDMVHGANSNIHQAWYKSQDIYEALENVPSADRPQGEWIYPTDIIGFGRCNNCKALWDKSLIDNIYFKYCPRCGAKMKGADNE